MNRNLFENMKEFIEALNYTEEKKLLMFLDSSIKKTSNDEVAHAMDQMDFFLKKNNIKITTKLFKICFIYFIWVGFHFVNIGDFQHAEAYHMYYNLKKEGIELEEFLYYEAGVLEFFEDSTSSC